MIKFNEYMKLVKRWRVRLNNEGGDPVSYTVSAATQREAEIEAWKLYRDLDFSDNEYPPKWTKVSSQLLPEWQKAVR